MSHAELSAGDAGSRAAGFSVPRPEPHRRPGGGFHPGTGGAGIAIDKNSTPPHLYIADSQNHRVLGFRDARTVTPGSKADLVIGQPDFFRAVANYPISGGTYDPNQPNDTSLSIPTDVVVDANGNLWVADYGNGRVLRYPSPFNQPAGTPIRASLALDSKASPRSFKTPALRTWVTRSAWRCSPMEAWPSPIPPSTACSFSSARREGLHQLHPERRYSAGAAGLFSIGAGSGQNQLSSPTHMATDSSDRLYVCDPGNNQFPNSRVVVFRQQSFTLPNGATAAAVLSGLNQPQGIYVSPLTGEIWITNTGGNQIGRFPLYETLFQSPVANLSQATAVIAAPAPLAITLDAFDNLIVAEGGNRVTFYYAKLTFQSPASYNSQPLAPGMLAILYQLGKPFSLTPDSAQAYPWPMTLSDLQVTVGGIPAPIFRVDASAINFQVPMTAPGSGNPEFLVRRASTGEIVAAALIPMNTSNPGFFTTSATGDGTVAAINDDGTVNSSSSPSRGDMSFRSI